MKANLLRAKIKERCKTQSEIADEIGISPNSLSRKLNGKREFTASEICKLKKSLEIEDAEVINEIFLS